MKFFLCTVWLLWGVLSHGQQVYDWINIQHIAGDMSEYPIKPYYRLEGKVKEIRESEKNMNVDGSYRITEITYTYFENGALDCIKQLEPDSSEFIFDYQFDKDWNFKYQVYSYIFSGLESRDTIQRDTFQLMYEVTLPDSVIKDEQGNILYYRLNRAETYTQFDAYGRKIMDSIPGNQLTAGHYMTFSYPKGMGKKRKILRKEYYPDQELMIKIKYKTDQFGNWTKCVIKSNRKWRNAVLKREILYY